MVRKNQADTRAYHKDYYANKPGRKEYIKAKVATRRAEIKEWFTAYRRGFKCIECGEDHPACLDFHHRDPSVKFRAITQMVSDMFGIAKIQEEMAKCDVMCSNCHRKLHWVEKDI